VTNCFAHRERQGEPDQFVSRDLSGFCVYLVKEIRVRVRERPVWSVSVLLCFLPASIHRVVREIEFLHLYMDFIRPHTEHTRFIMTARRKPVSSGAGGSRQPVTRTTFDELVRNDFQFLATVNHGDLGDDVDLVTRISPFSCFLSNV